MRGGTEPDSPRVNKGRQTPAMPNKDRATNPPPVKPGGEGWLVSPEQQLLCQFKPDAASVHAEWVVVSNYSWVPPRLSVLLLFQ